MIERRIIDPILHTHVADERQHRFLQAGIQEYRIFQFDVDRQGRRTQKFQDLRKKGDPGIGETGFARVGTKASEMLCREGCDIARRTRRTLQLLIMNDHQLPVRGKMHVQLDAVCAELRRFLEGGQCVLRSQ